MRNNTVHIYCSESPEVALLKLNVKADKGERVNHLPPPPDAFAARVDIRTRHPCSSVPTPPALPFSDIQLRPSSSVASRQFGRSHKTSCERGEKFDLTS